MEPQAKIVGLTGLVDMEQEAKAKQAGAEKVISKQMAYLGIQQLLESDLRRREDDDELSQYF